MLQLLQGRSGERGRAKNLLRLVFVVEEVHVHVRIACTVEEAIGGCSGGGPYWEWLPPLPGPLPDGPELLALVAGEPLLDPPAATAGGAVVPAIAGDSALPEVGE